MVAQDIYDVSEFWRIHFGIKCRKLNGLSVFGTSSPGGDMDSFSPCMTLPGNVGEQSNPPDPPVTDGSISTENYLTMRRNHKTHRHKQTHTLRERWCRECPEDECFSVVRCCGSINHDTLDRHDERNVTDYSNSIRLMEQVAYKCVCVRMTGWGVTTETNHSDS